MTEGSGVRLWELRFGVWGLGNDLVSDGGFGGYGLRFEVWDSGCGVRVWGAGCRVKGLGFGVWGSRCRVCGFEVSGLKVGVWGLGCRV